MRPFTSLAVLSMPRLHCGGVLLLVSGTAAFAQAPAGPMTPRPGSPVQQTPPDALNKITARVTLVSTPVTVRDSRGGMIHDLDQQDFLITDNGVPQKITHFDVGGDPLSMVVVVETSSRIDPMLAQLRKLGSIFTEQVMGPEAEAAVIGFDDSVHRLQGFTSSHDSIQSVFAGLKTGESGNHLFDAMSGGVEMLSRRRQPTPEAAFCWSFPKRSIPAAKPDSAKFCARRSSRTSQFSAWVSRPRAPRCKRSGARMLLFLPPRRA